MTMSELDIIQQRSVLEAIRDLAADRKQFEDLTLSTTEILALCLACELPLPASCYTEQDAWERLNKAQRRLVATINPKFQASVWADMPVYFG